MSAETLQLTRSRLWATEYNGWEVAYEGIGAPSDGAPSHLAWDNPMADDWNQPELFRRSFKFNSPSRGFLAINRTWNPDDSRKTSNFWRRDEFLTDAAGLTMEMRAIVHGSSDKDALFFGYQNEKSSASALISPKSVRLAPFTIRPGYGVRADFNTTGTYRIYRLVKYPSSRTVELYIDGERVLSWEATTAQRSDGSRPGYDFPFVLVGDNSSDEDFNANVTIDYVRYRRGAFPPGTPLGPVARRTPPALPRVATARETHVTIRGDDIPDTGPYHLRGRMIAWKELEDGILELDTSDARSNVYVDGDLPGLKSKGNVTIEMRVKLLPDAGARGFTLAYGDGIGNLSLTLSPRKIEGFIGAKPAGFKSYAVNLTDDFHTIRIVRPAMSLYYHVYIDDNPVPILADLHVGGNRPPGKFLHFGTLGYPDMNAKTHILIDFIRWRQGATAPRPLPKPRLLCSEDKGKTYKSSRCTSDVAIVRWASVPNADSCIAIASPASPKWRGAKSVSGGTSTIERPSVATRYTLECTNQTGTVQSSVMVVPSS